MSSRRFAITLLTFGALMSLGLAIYVSLNRGWPILETAHAILFGTMALVLASERSEGAASCRECGQLVGPSDFCLGCGAYPRPHAAS